MTRGLQSSSGPEASAWTHKIARKAMADTRAGGGDLAAQREAAIKAVLSVHPYLTREEVRLSVYAES